MLDAAILRELRVITGEEQAILDGRTTIDRSLYIQGRPNVVNSKKLLADGKLITLRPNTRFIHFPAHTHDYVEVVYGCAGVVEHIVDGRSIRLKPGELLFLGQRAAHEVCRTGREDIAVNFIVLPEFFRDTLSAIGHEATALRQFLVDCLFSQSVGPSYLHFQVADDLPIQNLAENLLFTLLRNTPNRRRVSQMTMTLLFLQLLSHTDKLDWDNREDDILKPQSCCTPMCTVCPASSAAGRVRPLPSSSRKSGWPRRLSCWTAPTGTWTRWPRRWGMRTSATSTAYSRPPMDSLPGSTGLPLQNRTLFS